MESKLYKTQNNQGVTFKQNGWKSASVYSDVNEEYATVKSAIGLLNRSDHSRIHLKGNDGIDFYHRMSTQDFKNLQPQAGRQTTLTTDKGRILDVQVVLPQNESTLILANPNSAQTSIAWLKKYIFTDDVTLTDWTSESVQFTLMGIQVEKFLSDFIRQDVTRWNNFQFSSVPIENSDMVILKNKPFGKLPIFDLIASNSLAEFLWNFLLEKGAAYGLLPVGLTVYEMLRIESGVPAVGHELTGDYNPLETGLVDTISWTKGCYIGQEVIARLMNYEKITKNLVGLAFGSGNTEPGQIIVKDGQPVGAITSVTYSLGLNQNIGLGIVRIPENQPGNKVIVRTETNDLEAEVRGLPFLT
jgi:hypothetical protein